MRRVAHPHRVHGWVDAPACGKPPPPWGERVVTRWRRGWSPWPLVPMGDPRPRAMAAVAPRHAGGTATGDVPRCWSGRLLSVSAHGWVGGAPGVMGTGRRTGALALGLRRLHRRSGAWVVMPNARWCDLFCRARLASGWDAPLSRDHYRWSRHAFFPAWLVGSNMVVRCFPRVLYPMPALCRCSDCWNALDFLAQSEAGCS